MAQPAVNPKEDFSSYLRQFDETLDKILKGEAKCSMQLKDLNLFKTIKYKIENYPILNELYEKIELAKNKSHRRLRGIRGSSRESSNDIYESEYSNSNPQSYSRIPSATPSNTAYGKFYSPSARDEIVERPISAGIRLHNNVLYTSSEAARVVESVITQLTTMIRYYKKLKISAFSSSAQKPELARVFKCSLFSLLSDQTFKMLLTSRQNGGIWVRESIVDIDADQGSLISYSGGNR